MEHEPQLDAIPLPTPRINPVGVLEVPAGYVQGTGQHRPWIRRLAWVFLALFASVTITTSILTLGAYCLTSDGGDGRALRQATEQVETLPGR